MDTKAYTVSVHPKYIKEFSRSYTKAHNGLAPSADFIQARIQEFVTNSFEDEVYADWLKQPNKCFAPS